jgi:hypothetical protein
MALTGALPVPMADAKSLDWGPSGRETCTYIGRSPAGNCVYQTVYRAGEALATLVNAVRLSLVGKGVMAGA